MEIVVFESFEELETLPAEEVAGLLPPTCESTCWLWTAIYD